LPRRLSKTTKNLRIADLWALYLANRKHDNIKMDIRKEGSRCDVDSYCSGWNRRQVGSIKDGEFLD
jgi:hypothetical protein